MDTLSQTRTRTLSQLLATTLSILTIAGCDSGSGITDTNTGYAMGPGVPVPTVLASVTNPDGTEPPVVDPLEGIDLQSPECSLDQKKLWLDANMRDDYLFYDQVPVVNLEDYDSVETLLDALRVQPLDTSSYITDIARTVRLFESGKAFGIGFNWRRDDTGLPRIAQIYNDSPIGRAGVSRGDIIESVNGIGWDDITDDQFNDALSEPSTWIFTDAINGAQIEVSLERAEYNVNAVLHYQTITNAEYNGVIGYLALNQFSSTASVEADTVMDFFIENNVTDLVLDLRYNRSGYDTYGNRLASQLLGPTAEGAVFAKYRFNDKYTENNSDFNLQSDVNKLGLNRLTVLTTESTEAIAELVINGLRPYIPVNIIGSTTRGTAYLSSNRDKCDKRLNIPVLESFNANDVSVTGGLVPDCAVADDLKTDFGLDGETGLIEGMLHSALDYLVYGTCNTSMNNASPHSISDHGLRKQEIAPLGAINSW